VRDDGALSTYWKAVDGTGGASPLSTDTQQAPNAFLPDGKKLFISQIRPGNKSDVGISTWAVPYDVSVDGQKFLMIKEDPAVDRSASQLDVVAVLNWVEELKRLVPVN